MLYLKNILLFGGAALLVFMLYTNFVDSNLYYRLFQLDSENLSSGRFESTLHWLNLSSEKYGGLGLGFISMYSQSVGGYVAHFENFPHNEFVRFYVEGGILGVFLVCFLVFFILNKSLKMVLNDNNNLRSTFSMAIFSIILVMSMLDNLFFDMYKSNFYYLMICLLSVSYTKEKIE